MKVAALAVCILTMHSWSALAQTATSDTASLPTTQQSTNNPQIDATKLGVSFDRIRIRLAVQPETKTSGLKIQETIQVIGTAPKIQLWDPETAKLATGPVPWGAPTHKEFMDLVTPQEFKTYPMDMNALMKWLMEQLAKKTEKKSSE